MTSPAGRDRSLRRQPADLHRYGLRGGFAEQQFQQPQPPRLSGPRLGRFRPACAATEPDGRVQGLGAVSTCDQQGHARSPGASVAEEIRQTGVLVKLLSPSGPVPLHADPTRASAGGTLRSPFGKTEAWILLDTPGRRPRPAYAGIGFQPGVDPGLVPPTQSTGTTTRPAPQRAPHRRAGGRGVRGARRRAALPRAAAVVHRGAGAERSHRDPGDVRRGRRGGDDGPGLGTGPGHDRLRRRRQREPRSPGPVSSRGCCGPAAARARCGCSRDDVLEFFDATALEVADEIEVADGRFSIAIVTSGRRLGRR